MAAGQPNISDRNAEFEYSDMTVNEVRCNNILATGDNGFSVSDMSSGMTCTLVTFCDQGCTGNWDDETTVTGNTDVVKLSHAVRSVGTVCSMNGEPDSGKFNRDEFDPDCEGDTGN